MIITAYDIPHKSQRYPTVGDWQTGRGPDFNIKVSSMPDWRHEFLVALHELLEAALCYHRHISDAEVTAFDVSYTGEGEPGDDPGAPYRNEHIYATSIERLVAAELEVDWAEYEKELNSL